LGTLVTAATDVLTTHARLATPMVMNPRTFRSCT
jgi:hypothetical protein